MRKTKVSYRKLYKEEVQKVESLTNSMEAIRKIQETVKRILLGAVVFYVLSLLIKLIKYLKV